MLRRTLLKSLPGAALATTAARAAAPVRLRVSVGPYINMCPFYWGYESGYFAGAGFDIQVVQSIGSTQAIPLAAGGRLDVCFLAQSPPLLNAVARGARIRIVAGRDVASATCRPIGAVYARRRAYPNGLRDLRVLRGKKVAVSGNLGGATHFALDLLLERAGIRTSDVETVGLGTGEGLAALRSGAVEAYVASATDYTQVMDTLQLAPGPSLGDVLPGFQYSHILFGSALLDGDVGVGARFLAVWLRSAREFAAGSSPKFMDEFAKANDLDPKAVRGGCRGGLLLDGAIRTKDLQFYIDWAARKGFCPAGLKAATCVDGRFLAAVERSAR